MTIQDIHSWLDFVCNKAQGSYFTPPEKDAALDRAQMAYFNTLYSEYAIAEKLQDALSPFKTKFPFLTSDTVTGLLAFPADYQYLLAVQIVVVDVTRNKYRPVKILSEDELAYRLSSQLRPVSANKPVGMIAGRVSATTLLQLYPEVPMAGTAFYLRRPAVPVYAFTQTGRTIAYDASASIQLEWNETEINEILMRTLELLGISEPDETIMQYANAKQKEIT